MLCCHVWENRLSAEGFLFTWASVPLPIYHFAFSRFVSFLFTAYCNKLWTAPPSVSAVHNVLEILIHIFVYHKRAHVNFWFLLIGCPSIQERESYKSKLPHYDIIFLLWSTIYIDECWTLFLCDFVFVCLCFPVYVFSYFCVWSFSLSVLQMMSVGLTVLVPQHPLPLASLSDLVSRDVEKSLKMRTVLHFWQFWSKYIYDLSRGMIVNMHTHTPPPRGGKLPRKMRWIVALAVDTSIAYLQKIHTEHFFLVQFQWHGIKNTLHTTLKARQKVSLLLRYLTRSICQPSEEGVDSKDRDINRWEVNLSSDRWLVASRVHFLSIPPQTFSSHHLLLTKSSLSGKILLDSGGEENVGQFNEKLDVAISWKFKRTVRKNSWN